MVLFVCMCMCDQKTTCFASYLAINCCQGLYTDCNALKIYMSTIKNAVNTYNIIVSHGSSAIDRCLSIIALQFPVAQPSRLLWNPCTIRLVGVLLHPPLLFIEDYNFTACTGSGSRQSHINIMMCE